jgi:hypothetical protein
METTKQIKTRFDAAFKRYSVHDTKLRNRCAEVVPDTEAACGNTVSDERQLLSDAEDEYQTARTDYVNRLLAE